MRDALDAAWGDFPTDDVGYEWLRYTGSARPDGEWCHAVTQHSRLTFIHERYSTRSQEGFGAGLEDCRVAEARAREVHPGVESIAVAVSDGDGADNWDASEYGKGWAAAATLHFFPYGAVPICESFLTGAAGSPFRLDGTWVPETWGNGTFLSQVVGTSPVANTDLNHAHKAYWPDATQAPASSTPTTTPEDDGMVFVTRKDGKTYCYWRHDDKLLMRGFTSGTPDKNIATVSSDCDPHNPVVRDAGFGILYTPSKDGRLVRVTQTNFGPKAEIV